MTWTYFIVFPAIGAVIGAVTNELAIKMLFRPYKPIYIGKFKLPLTPGVIPSQRERIAQNIAETFEKHLLSGDEIHEAVVSDKSRGIIEKKVDEMFSSLGPLAMMVGGFKTKIVDKIIDGIDEVARQGIEGGDLNIKQRIEDKINEMPVQQLEDLILGFSRKQFRHITIFGALLGGMIGLIQAFLAPVLQGL